jgi:hypothetical protein
MAESTLLSSTEDLAQWLFTARVCALGGVHPHSDKPGWTASARKSAVRRAPPPIPQPRLPSPFLATRFARGTPALRMEETCP